MAFESFTKGKAGTVFRYGACHLPDVASVEGMPSLSPEVAHALKTGVGVVALESTIITHGMPYPQNLETALLVERTVRDNGAVPATIAIINGVVKVGLSRDELEYLAKIKNAPKKVMTRRTSLREDQTAFLSSV